MNKLFIFILINLLIIPSGLMSTPYSIKDLEILAQESNYDEFLAHALDVRPSERLDNWKLMVSNMADGYAKKILSKTDVKKEDLASIESLFAWPQLKTDSVFKTRRIEIGLKYFKTCLKSEKPCWNELKSFWENDPNDPDLAQQLAFLTKDLKDSPISAWSFLEVALKDPLSEFYCKKEFIQDEVWKNLKISYNTLTKDADFLKIIDTTLHPDCLVSINKVATARIYKPLAEGDREFAYQFLSSQGKNNNDLKDFFYTIYLLENPSQGELFNYSWNRLSDLSKSVIRREKVLKQISRLDPLPDQILSSLDEAKKRAILNHFKDKFPEYFQHYAQQCVNYYSGQGLFPYGNPTMNCSKFMNSPEATSMLGQDMISKFKQATSI